MKHLSGKLNASFSLLVFVAVTLFSTTGTNARSWRVGQIPNGSKFSCRNCHNSSYGGSRNSFGRTVESVVGRGSTAAFWSAVLAAKDSDGDGSSNGDELGDPDGDGKPIDGSQVTNPGDPKSKPTNVVDTTAPVITLVGTAVVTVEAGSEYADAGANARDSVDGDLSGKIKVSGEVDTSEVGSYTVSYTVKDGVGNEAEEVTRLVVVQSRSVAPPELVILQAKPFAFSFTSRNRVIYKIEASSDLRTWKPIAQIIGTGLKEKFSDLQETKFTHRYYRLKVGN